MGETTSASVLLASMAVSRAAASKNAACAVNLIGPNSSRRVPSPAGVMAGQPSVAGPGGGYSPGSTCACMSMSMGLGPSRVDRHVHRGLLPGLAGQRLDGVGHVREPEAVRVQLLQREAARLDDPDGVRVAPGVHAEGPDHGGPLVDDQVGVDRMRLPA